MKKRAPTAPSRLLALALLAAAGLVACGGKVPETHQWTLKPAASGAPERADVAGPRLGVSRFSAALEVRTTELTWRDAAGLEVRHRGYDAWVDFPDRMLEQVVLARLGASGRFSTVVRTPPSKALDGVLTCRLVDFTEVVAGDASTARVAVDWKVTDFDGRTKAGGLLEETEPATAKTVDQHVAAMQRATDRLAARLVDEAAKALAAAP